MKSNSQVRAAGRADLSGRWSEAAMFTFVYYVICGIFSAAVGGAAGLALRGSSSFLTILLLPMAWGYACAFIALHRREDGDTFDIWHLFDGYRDFRRVFCTSLLVYLYTTLWTLLFIIPGIVKGCSYAMTDFILRDRKDLTNNAAIDLSSAMMYHHRMDYFLLQLSFIGWAILCIPTLGIGFFWLVPYMAAARANFYEEVKRDFELGGDVAEAEVVEECKTTDNYQK